VKLVTAGVDATVNGSFEAKVVAGVGVSATEGVENPVAPVIIA